MPHDVAPVDARIGIILHIPTNKILNVSPTETTWDQFGSEWILPHNLDVTISS
jgi:hypothetical protein